MFSWFKHTVASLTAEFHYLADKLEALAKRLESEAAQKKAEAEKAAKEAEAHLAHAADASRIAEQVRKVFG